MTVDKSYLMGHFEPSEHPDFERVPIRYASREGMYLHREALTAFRQMESAAREAGHRLVIVSATRNFDYQKNIWEAKWQGRRLLSGGINAATRYSNPAERATAILRYSAMPGASRHHWGTDMDFNAFNNSYFENGPGKALFQWLEVHAGAFGFCRPYSAKGPIRPHGYEEEKWHWSYLPLSKPLTEAAARQLSDSDFEGFAGSETATELKVVQHYVLGLAPECR